MALYNLQPVLEKQIKSLEEIEKVSKQDRLIQLAQLYEEKRLDDENKGELKELKSVNENLKQVVEKLDSGQKKISDNVIKLADHIGKVATGTSRPLSADENQSILKTVGARPAFNGWDNFKDDVKDMFTMRGFFDKVSPLSTFGIGVRGGKGILSSALDKQEAKKKYIDARLETQGTTFGSKETFARQFDEQQAIQKKIGKNQERIQELRDMGFKDVAIKRSGLLGEQDKLATEMAKVDTRVRPEGFDPRTGKVKDKPQSAKEQEFKAESAKVIPFAKPSGEGLGGEENMLEQNRMVAEQGELLKKIEENTRSLKGTTTQGPSTTQAPAAPAGEGGGLLDMLPTGGGKIGKMAKGLGGRLMGGARALGNFALKRAGPLAAAAEVVGGAYTAYSGWGEASDAEKEKLGSIDEQVASGKMTEEDAKALRKEAREEGTVKRSGAVGEGAGQAIGGAAGAMKGMAVGAAIGSAIPVVGTAIGGAVGAVVGAAGGAFLGKTAGKWMGEKWGQAKNFFFGKSGDAEGRAKEEDTSSSVSIDFSEAQFAEKDPENYQKFTSFRDELTETYAKKQAEKFKHKEPTPADRKVARMMAQKDAVLKFRKEIEAAGAGKVTGGKKEEAPGDKTKEALKGSATGALGGSSSSESYTKIAGEKVVPGQDLSEKQMATIGMAKSQGNSYSPEIEAQYAKQLKQPTAAGTASSGDAVTNASSQNEQAKLEATKGGAGNNIISAPTVNNNSTVQNNAPKLPPRNTDSTINKYLERRYA